MLVGVITFTMIYLYTVTVAAQGQVHKLVEIYHNNAAKNSDSDEGNLQKSRAKRLPVNQSKKTTSSRFLSVNEVPPIDIPEPAEVVGHQDDEMDAPVLPLETLRSLEPCNLEPLQAPRTEISCYSKNYELPTIASRMKQVAKSYLGSFTFKVISSYIYSIWHAVKLNDIFPGYPILCGDFHQSQSQYRHQHPASHEHH